MQKNTTYKFESDLVKVGWYQIIGGATGLLLLLALAIPSLTFTSLNILILILMSAFFVYSILCGILCLKAKRGATVHSLINQFLQLISLTIAGFSFMYVAGVYLTIGFDLSKSFEIAFGFGISGFNFEINKESNDTVINVNLVALGLIYWIDRLRKKIKEEKAAIEIASIGKG